MICRLKFSILERLQLFTDGSVHVQSGIGYGAFLLISDEEMSIDEMKKSVQVIRFESTTSTKLELQILLWALGTIHKKYNEIIVFSDSQNISGLMSRRKRLEQNDFISKTSRRLTNADLYQKIFAITDKRNVKFVKVKGHKSSKEKSKVDQIFTLVDRASRRALRNELSIRT